MDTNLENKIKIGVLRDTLDEDTTPRLYLGLGELLTARNFAGSYFIDYLIGQENFNPDEISISQSEFNETMIAILPNQSPVYSISSGDGFKDKCVLPCPAPDRGLLSKYILVDSTTSNIEQRELLQRFKEYISKHQVFALKK